jgi:hypothetical protein
MRADVVWRGLLDSKVCAIEVHLSFLLLVVVMFSRSDQHVQNFAREIVDYHIQLSLSRPNNLPARNNHPSASHLKQPFI